METLSATERNDQKRAEAARLVAECKAAGWTVKELAQLFACTPGAVGSWGRGDSMATNQIREEMAKLPAVADRSAYLIRAVEDRIAFMRSRKWISEEAIAKWTTLLGQLIATRSKAVR